MSTTTLAASTPATPAGTPAGNPARTAPVTHRPIPMTRIAAVELRKMFDTRSGAWLMASIAGTALLATVAVIAFAPDSALTYETFATAIGFPMAVILPIVAILSVTSEWSQRTGLTTFTFVPHRGRVVTAKLVDVVLVGVVSILLAAGIGALGNLVGTAITGTDTVWDISLAEMAMIVLANVLGLLVGFALGVLVRSSAGAVVGYFVYAFVLPPLSMLLATSQQWWRDLQPWLDFSWASGELFNGVPNAEQWAQIGTSGLLWLVLPLAVGLRLVLRSEVK